MTTLPQKFELAVQHHQAGDLHSAEQLYRQILQINPELAQVLHLLGLVALQLGKKDQAVEYMGEAIRLQPDLVEAHCNRGIALKALGKLPEAVASYRQALRFKPDYAEAHNNLGVVLQALGQLKEAAACYLEALRLQPAYAEAHNNLGMALEEQGKPAEAVRCYQEALRLQPHNPKAHHKLGVALEATGKLEEAIASFDQALRLQPVFAEAHNHRGHACRLLGKLDEAVASWQKALRIKPDEAEIHANLGLAFREQGKLAEAAASLQEALRIQPGYVEALNTLGVVLLEQRKLSEAAAPLQEALRLQPDHAGAHGNLANVFALQGKWTEAVASFQEVLRLKPDYAEAHHDLGLALLELDMLPEAEASLRQALHVKPDYVEAHNNLGVALKEQRKLSEAKASLQEALRRQPDHAAAHNRLAMTWLLEGNFEQGWPEYEWRWKYKTFTLPDFPQPLWDGSTLEGQTILLFAEQGLGDVLQFIRFAPQVKERVAKTVLLCAPSLVRLLENSPGIDAVVAKGSALPSFDVYIPLMSLPRVLGTSLATVPARVPYLYPPPALVEAWREELRQEPSFKIGIIWQGSPDHLNDRNRSAALADFAPLARIKGVRFFSLQKGAAARQGDAMAGPFSVTDLGNRLGDFADTAAVIENLDLVISVDTSVVHCAGALGVPVWVALPFSPDWRWLLDREDSPWYPTARLFRQQERGRWGPVFEGMASALEAMVQSWREAMEVKPNQAEVHNRRALAFLEQGKLSEAATGFLEVLRLRPDNAEALNNLAYAYFGQDRFVEAEASLRQALGLEPEYVEARNNLGIVLKEQGKLHEAAASFEEVLRMRPDHVEAHNRLATTWLAMGNYEQGWVEYEWRWKYKGLTMPSYPQPLWDGSRLDGRTLLLHAEQGLGDTLQFIRYAPGVKERGGSVVLLCPAVLAPLLKACPGIDQVVTKGGSLPPFDVHLPLLSLPRIFATSLATLPAEVPYLYPDEGKSAHWQRQLRAFGKKGDSPLDLGGQSPFFPNALSQYGSLKIGICWLGSQVPPRNRSVPLGHFAPLARLDGVQLFSLQKDTTAGPSDAGAAPFPLIDLDAYLGDFGDTAAVTKNLDLVVSVDTAVAHCAGALGVPVWVALPCSADWRWLLAREDSPWYPTMRLFRQTEPGNWEGVFARITQEIQERWGVPSRQG